MFRKHLLVVLALAAVCGSFLAGATPAQAAATGKLLVGRGGDIYSVLPNGTGLTKLATNGAEAVYSPDRTRIAFTRNDDIYTMNANGSNVQQVTKVGSWEGSPTWSPDGKWLAFESDRLNDYEIFKLRSTTPYGKAIRVTHVSEQDYEYWCFEGSSIAQHPTWNPKNGGQILANYDCGQGQNYHAIFDASTGAVIKFMQQEYGYNPDWTPNGKAFAYTSNRCMDDEGNGNTNVHWTGLTGGGGDVTPCSSAPTSSLPHTNSPQWSPDGTMLAYNQSGAVWAANKNGSGKRMLLADAFVWDWVR